MKIILFLLVVFSLIGKVFSQDNLGDFKFTVRTQSDSLINNYTLLVINEKSRDTLEFESFNSNQTIKLADGSYTMFCKSGSLSVQVIGVIIHSNHLTFYDFKLENKLTTKQKKRKNKST